MIIIPKLPIFTKLLNTIIRTGGMKFKVYQTDKIICYLGFGVWYVIGIFTPEERSWFFHVTEAKLATDDWPHLKLVL